jgi:hypothetical protein
MEWIDEKDLLQLIKIMPFFFFSPGENISIPKKKKRPS